MTVPRQGGPNSVLVNRPNSRYQLATPALVLDLDALEHNIRAMAGLCAQRNIALRPHAKTHKSVRVARMQIDAGAVGVCTATIREAEVMVSAGIPGVHLTTPVHGALRLETLVSLIARSRGLTAVVDDLENLRQLEDCVRRAGTKLPVLVDLDLGAMFRTGVASSGDAMALAIALARSDVLEYAGIQYYSGIIQHVARAEERARHYGLELERLATLIDQLNRAGLPPKTVTGGGTGTLDLDARSGLFTENQAGSYVVMDVEYCEVELLASQRCPFEPALFVQSTVVSNNARGLVTIDAGTKALATDGPPPRPATGAPDGASYHSFGDEFGMIIFKGLGERLRQGGRDGATDDPEADSYRRFHALFDTAPGDAKSLPLGAKVELLVPHCDPTVNLHDYYHCVRGDTLVEIWPVDARGSL